MSKKKLIPAVIAVVLCIATAVCIPVFAKDGYANLPANANSDNLAVKCIESIIDSKGNKNAEKAADGDINTVWKSSGKADSLILTFKEEQTFNTVILREKDWKINSFQLSYFVEDDKGGYWEMFYKQERIDDFRLCAFDAVTSKQLKFEVTDASGKFKIREIEVYNIDKKARSEFRVSDYLVLPELANGSAYDPESENYFDPEYCSFVNQLHLIAVGCWDNEGNININDGFNKETIKAEVEKIREIYGENDVDIFATIFFNRCDPTTVLTEHKEEVIKNTVDLLVYAGFDGVSYDWEYPENNLQWELYNEHLISLKKELSKHDLLLSIATSAFNNNFTKEAIEALDQVEIMSYDNVDHTGHHSSFTSGAVQPVEYMLSIGFSKEQLNLGLPFYARPTDGGPIWIDIDDPAYTPADKFQNLSKDMWFSGPQMTRDKVAYAIANDLGGMMIFTLAEDLPYNHELSGARVIKETIDERIEFTNEEGDTQ